jgi:hypothetical protein
MSLTTRVSVTIAMIVLLFVLYAAQYGTSPEGWAVCAAGALGWLCTSPH